MRALRLVFFSCVALLLLVGCGGETATESDKLNVVATTGQLHDTVSNIAGDAVVLTGLLGPGIDPHAYKPTQKARRALDAADVIFYNGLFLEAGMGEVLDQLAETGEKAAVVAVGDNLDAEQLLGWEGYDYDPHVWNDPLLWRDVVTQVRDTLVTADPDNADLYERNAAAYLAEIEATHDELTALYDSIPADKRVIITAHDAFGYLARTYGLDVKGLQGISTESKASANDVITLADFIVEREIPAIFVESSVSKDAVEAVQAAVQDRGFNVVIGGELLSDALGEEGSDGATYLGMLRYNAQTISEALTK